MGGVILGEEIPVTCDTVDQSQRMVDEKPTVSLTRRSFDLDTWSATCTGRPEPRFDASNRGVGDSGGGESERERRQEGE